MLKNSVHAQSFELMKTNDENTLMRKPQSWLHLILCDDATCRHADHLSAIDRMYNHVVLALSEASSDISKCMSHHDNQIAGWNDVCKTAHGHARDAYLFWRMNGKPKYGFCMKKWGNLGHSSSTYYVDVNIKIADLLQIELLQIF